MTGPSASEVQIDAPATGDLGFTAGEARFGRFNAAVEAEPGPAVKDRSNVEQLGGEITLAGKRPAPGLGPQGAGLAIRHYAGGVVDRPAFSMKRLDQAEAQGIGVAEHAAPLEADLERGGQD